MAQVLSAGAVSTGEQHAEVFSLPLQSGGVQGKGFLPVAEGAWMVHAPARPVSAGKDLMEHFMEDDEFDEEARNRGLVERWMKTDFSCLVVVNAQPDGLAAPATRASSPPYGSPHPALKMQLVERLENLTQVISPTPR